MLATTVANQLRAVWPIQQMIKIPPVRKKLSPANYLIIFLIFFNFNFDGFKLILKKYHFIMKLCI